MKREFIKMMTLALGVAACSCGSNIDLNEEDIVKSDISKADETELIAVNETFNAEGGMIYIDVANKDWSIEYISCGGIEDKLPENIDYKKFCVDYDVAHIYGNLEFRSTDDELSIRVYPNEGEVSAYDSDKPDGIFKPWGKSSPRKIEMVLRVGDKTYQYNIEQSGVEDPSLYPFAPEKNLYVLPGAGGECTINVSTALFWMQVCDENTRLVFGRSGHLFPKDPIVMENDWIKITRDGAIITAEAQPNTTGKERKCELSLQYLDYFNSVVVTQGID